MADETDVSFSWIEAPAGEPRIAPFQPTIVFATAQACVPCMFVKPVIRKLAIQLGGAFTLVEVSSETAPAFKAEHGIDRVPQLLAFKNGQLVERTVGYHGDTLIAEFVERAFDLRHPRPADPAEKRFADDLASAHTAFEAAMTPASEALEPHFRAVEPAFRDIETRLDGEVAAGKLTPREAGRILCTEQACLFEPFKDKVEALGHAQNAAMAIFEKSAASCVESYAVARMKSKSRVCYGV